MNKDKQIIEEMANDIDKSHWKIEQDFTGCHINSDKIAEYLIKQGWRKQSEPFSQAHENGSEWISVEVVRCKDCKHYKPQTLSKRWENKTKYCCRCAVVKVKDNDFCSYGEPKMKGGGE